MAALYAPHLAGILVLLVLRVAISAPTGDNDASLQSYIVHLKYEVAPPVILYDGSIPGFPATATSAVADVSPSTQATTTAANRFRFGRRIPRINRAARHVRQYVNYLTSLHRDVAAQVGVAGSRIFHSYTHTMNGFAARLTPSQVRLLQQHPSVAYVQRDSLVHTTTMYSPKFINVSSGVWPAVGGQSNAGKEIIIGVIDTGIWPEHPSFSDAHMSDATIPSYWKGVCNTSSDFPSSSCNKKLIGARYFIDGFLAQGDTLDSSDYKSPRDGNGHGTWCASASAGAPSVPVRYRFRNYGRASGLAPGAFLASYKALWVVKGGGSGSNADVAAAVDNAVADGCDVISMSLGYYPYTNYFDDISRLNAAKAGVFLALAAGNEGTPVSGSGFSSKLSNAAPFYLTVGASTMDRHYTPIRKKARYNLVAPLVSSFSSRGPLVDPSVTSAGDVTNDILKPDLMGPGEALWGAYKASTPGTGVRQQFKMESGTSMATPHLAGIAAMIMAKNPSWSVAQIKSAMMTTTKQVSNVNGPIQDAANGNGVTPWDMGSGQVDGSRILNPGLTFDAGFDDYKQFLAGQDAAMATATFGAVTPINGYDLNQPNIVVSLLKGTVSVTRKVTNVGTASATYQAKLVAPSGAAVTVSPTSFTVGVGLTATFTVSFTSQSTSKQFSFGNLTWTDGSGHSVFCVLGVQGVP